MDHLKTLSLGSLVVNFNLNTSDNQIVDENTIHIKIIFKRKSLQHLVYTLNYYSTIRYFDKSYSFKRRNDEITPLVKATLTAKTSQLDGSLENT